MLNLFIFVTTFFINIFLIFIILKKQKKHNINLNNIVFVLAVLFLIFWSISNYLADTNLGIEYSFFWTKMTFPFSLLGVWFILWFSFSFPKKIFNYTLLNIFYFCLVLLFSFFSMTDKIVANIDFVQGVGVTDVALGRFYPFIIILYLVMVINIALNLSCKYKRLKGAEKMQVAYVILGWSLFIIAGLITNLILPFVTGNALWSKFGPLMSVVMVSFTAYAIIRYKFFDIRIIIQKGLVYSTLLIIIIGFYLLLVSIVGIFFQQSTDMAILISAGLTTIVGIFGVPFIKRYFDHLTDKIFFKDKYNFSEVINTLSEILNRNLHLQVLKREIIAKLKEILKIKKVILDLKDDPVGNKLKINYSYLQKNLEKKKNILTKEEFLKVVKSKKAKTSTTEFLKFLQNEKEGIELVVVLRIKARVIGFMFLSPKLSFEQYSEEDISLLKSISYQIAVAVEKARLYKKLENYSHDLEKEVEKRTVEIGQLQNEQKQIMLDISHGLQTPITIIKGELELMRKKSPKNKKLIAFEMSLNRISKLIGDLLSLSKLEVQKEEGQKKKINLSLALEEMAEYFAVVLLDKKIIFKYNILTDVFVYGNISQIEELVHSLVSNSIKYIGQGNKIEMDLKTFENQAVLSIKDDGVGVDVDSLPFVFNRFYRAKNTNQKGSGLGLAISKKIVELHRGTISMTSEFKKGTEVVVTFPLA